MLRDYCSSLGGLAGWRFVVFLVVVYLGGKGGGATFLEMAMLPLFKDIIGVSSAVYQRCRILIFLPFSLKPAVGSLIDAYNASRSVSTVSLVAAGAAAFALASKNPGVSGAVAAGFICVAGIACSDLVAEGKYASVMQSAPEAGSLFVTLVWAVIFVSRLIVAAACSLIFVGSDVPSQPLFIMAGIFFVAGSFPSALGWHQPVIQIRPLRQPTNDSTFMLRLLALLMTVSAVGIAIITFGTFDSQAQLVVVGLFAFLLVMAARYCLPTSMWGCLLYLFASAALYVDVSSLDYFYTSECVENGPHFSYAYYLSAGSVVSSILGPSPPCSSKSSFRRGRFGSASFSPPCSSASARSWTSP